MFNFRTLLIAVLGASFVSSASSMHFIEQPTSNLKSSVNAQTVASFISKNLVVDFAGIDVFVMGDLININVEFTGTKKELLSKLKQKEINLNSYQKTVFLNEEKLICGAWGDNGGLAGGITVGFHYFTKDHYELFRNVHYEC